LPFDFLQAFIDFLALSACIVTTYFPSNPKWPKI
jgi:hypothetical protein